MRGLMMDRPLLISSMIDFADLLVSASTVTALIYFHLDEYAINATIPLVVGTAIAIAGVALGLKRIEGVHIGQGKERAVCLTVTIVSQEETSGWRATIFRSLSSPAPE